MYIKMDMIKVILDRNDYYRYKIIITWCQEQFGTGRITPNGIGFKSFDGRWQLRETFGHQIYEFEHETDAVLFKLKWI